jgi:hypothetical protein
LGGINLSKTFWHQLQIITRQSLDICGCGKNCGKVSQPESSRDKVWQFRHRNCNGMQTEKEVWNQYRSCLSYIKKKIGSSCPYKQE